MIARVAIEYHSGKPEAVKTAERVRKLIARKKATVVSLAKAQVLIVVGGDGTILSSAPAAAKAGVPMVGINVGRLGFLAECALDNYETAVADILAENFRVEERRMLDVFEVTAGGRRRALGAALNEMLLVRAGLARIVEIAVSVGDDSSSPFNADGVMVSTPTGSTGHALAAGGPVISPSLRAFLIVPICPHPPRVRPMVVDEGPITVTWPGRYPDLQVSLDGQRTHPLTSGRVSLMVTPSEYSAKFVRLTRRHAPSFYTIVRQKLI